MGLGDGMSIGGFAPLNKPADRPAVTIVSTNRCYVPECPSPIINEQSFNKSLPSRTINGCTQYRHRWHGGTSGSMQRKYPYIIDLYEACNFVARQLIDDSINYEHWRKARLELRRIFFVKVD